MHTGKEMEIQRFTFYSTTKKQANVTFVAIQMLVGPTFELLESSEISHIWSLAEVRLAVHDIVFYLISFRQSNEGRAGDKGIRSADCRYTLSHSLLFKKKSYLELLFPT
ncbi:hypothetical protein ACP275_08G011900 [Erythranthe tilingii]